MKLLTILCFSFFVVFTYSAISISDEHMNMIMELLKECQAKEGGSDDDMALLLKGGNPETHESHCMITCVNEKMGVVGLNMQALLSNHFNKFFQSSRMESWIKLGSWKWRSKS